MIMFLLIDFDKRKIEKKKFCTKYMLQIPSFVLRAGVG